MKGVLLINMGGPGNPQELKGFLKLMFLDKHIIAAPFPVRKMLSILISNTRYRKSWKKYEIIGGTPLKHDTEMLCALLSSELGESFLVRPCYSYSQPFIHEALDEMDSLGIEEILTIPLYPHYSITTTQSVIDDLESEKGNLMIGVSQSFYHHPQFIRFWNTLVTAHVSNQGLKQPHLLFSAHSIPLSFIRKGDPYAKQIEESARLIAESTGFSYSFSYQSGMNAKTWLGPDTGKKIAELKNAGTNEIVIIPISFVSENLETLYDLDCVLVPEAREKNIHVSRVKINPHVDEFVELLKILVYEYYH
jgi:protoporphyrin/coproporphyrin ferrochelatase